MQLQYKLDKRLLLFYLEMLDNLRELHQVNQGSYKSDFILWNNQVITIEGNLEEVGQKWNYYIQDILTEKW